MRCIIEIKYGSGDISSVSFEKLNCTQLTTEMLERLEENSTCGVMQKL